MPRVTPLSRLFIAVLFTALVGATSASATNYSITWLDMSPTAVNSNFPSGSVFNVPGIGNVTVTYGIPGDWTLARAQIPSFTTGNVVSGPDVYSWNNYEYVGTIFTAGALGPVVGTITFTFPGTLPANSVFVGTIGLGRTSDDGTGTGGISTTRVLQNGTVLGDYVGDASFGASSFFDGIGFFSVWNSQTGPGGLNPWWNTQLGVVRVDDAVSSITVFQTALRGDGIGVNVGFDVDLTTPVGTTSWGRIKSIYR